MTRTVACSPSQIPIAPWLPPAMALPVFHDGLDRQISVQEPDQNVVSNVYDVQTSPIMGQAVIATDETGRQRRAVIDGFGRLVDGMTSGVPSGGVQATASVAISGAFNSTWAGAARHTWRQQERPLQA